MCVNVLPMNPQTRFLFYLSEPAIRDLEWKSGATSTRASTHSLLATAAATSLLLFFSRFHRDSRPWKEREKVWTHMGRPWKESRVKKDQKEIKRTPVRARKEERTLNVRFISGKMGGRMTFFFFLLLHMKKARKMLNKDDSEKIWGESEEMQMCRIFSSAIIFPPPFISVFAAKAKTLSL